jgi:hypothetical protein
MAYLLFVIPLGFFLLVLQFVRDFVAGIRSLGSEEEEKTSEGGRH